MSASDAVILLVADGMVAAGRVLGRLRRRCDAEKRAQVCDADALTRAEESVDVLEPSDFPACTCPSRLAADVDDHWPACGARAGDSPAADEPVSPAAGRTFGQAERDAYFAGLKWPEPKVEVPERSPKWLRDIVATTEEWAADVQSLYVRSTQIEHVATMIEAWLEDGDSCEGLATRIVDMLAADKRIAERLDGAG